MVRPQLALDYIAKHAIDFWLTTEDLPHPANRVTVDRQGRIHVAKTYHNLEPHKRLLGKLKELMGPLGCHEAAIPSWSILDQRIPLAGNAHQCGTVRFGTDPVELGARRQLPRARRRQPVRGRHELLPVERGGQPGTDRDGQRAPGRRPPARAPRRARRGGRSTGGNAKPVEVLS